MLGLLKKGNKVLFSKSNNPKRKLKFTLEIIKVSRKLDCMIDGTSGQGIIQYNQD